MPPYELTTDLDRAVDRILWLEWDPIGVKHLGSKDDTEYRRYVGPFVEMLRNGADRDDIAKQLRKFAVGRMGLRPRDPSQEKSREDERVAELLLAAYAEKG